MTFCPLKRPLSKENKIHKEKEVLHQPSNTSKLLLRKDWCKVELSNFTCISFITDMNLQGFLVDAALSSFNLKHFYLYIQIFLLSSSLQNGMYIPKTHKSFGVFVVKEINNFQGNFIFSLFKNWPSASTHFDHLSGKLWIPHQKNFFLLWQTTCLAIFQLLQNYATLQAHIALMRRDGSQMAPGQGSTAGTEGCPMHAIFQVSFASFDVWDGALSCNKITLSCLLAHSGHFCHVFWPIPVFFDQCMIQINHLLTITLCVNGFACKSSSLPFCGLLECTLSFTLKLPL